MNALESVPTAELVEELMKRPGVRAEAVDPYMEHSVTCTGPVIVIIVED